MTVIQQSSEVTDGQKQLRIVGEPSKVDYAEQLVNDMLNDKEPDGANRFKVRQPSEYGPGMHTMELPVSPQYIGLVIGKGGESIKRIAQETGAKLQVDTTKSDHSGNKICQISSMNMASVNMAADMVKQILENAANGRPSGGGGGNQYGQQDEVRIQVPPNKTGLVIGKGGETVKGLKQQAGCNIELDKNSKGVFVIRGAPDRIAYAQQLISEKIQSPITVLSSSGGGSGANQADAYSDQYWQSAAAQNPYAFAQDPTKNLSDPNGTFQLDFI
jgi:far upstream element-binding protein